MRFLADFSAYVISFRTYFQNKKIKYKNAIDLYSKKDANKKYQKSACFFLNVHPICQKIGK